MLLVIVYLISHATVELKKLWMFNPGWVEAIWSNWTGINNNNNKSRYIHGGGAAVVDDVWNSDVVVSDFVDDISSVVAPGVSVVCLSFQVLSFCVVCGLKTQINRYQCNYFSFWCRQKICIKIREYCLMIIYNGGHKVNNEINILTPADAMWDHET